MICTTPSLLITDDDQDFRETLRGALEPKGFRTLVAGDGEEALKVVRREEVHLVLLDVHMPRLSGLETLKRLHEFRAILPCILLSAQLDEKILEQARLARAFSVLSKTVTLRQITHVVQQALEGTYNWRS
ncbi:MAG: response regulator [Pirellulales bacterium]|nr:response regulator [Pirellulales bacterium]